MTVTARVTPIESDGRAARDAAPATLPTLTAAFAGLRHTRPGSSSERVQEG